MSAETHAVYAPPISFFDCYGNDSQAGPIAELWEEAPTTSVTEDEMALLWCHEDMNSPSWWTDRAYMAAEN